MAEFEMVGSVKWFNHRKGYGFIISDSGPPDILFLKSSLRELNLNDVRPGSRVRCVTEEAPKGLCVKKFITIDQSLVQRDPQVFPIRPIAVMESAVVKSFDTKRGFGFLRSVKSSRPPDIFIHMETLRRCEVGSLQPGQQVYVTYGQGPRGPLALALRLWP